MKTEATAFALECIQCIGRNSDTCDGPSVVCKKAKKCMVISEFLHFDEHTYHTVKKDCNELYPCGKTLYASTQYELTLRSHIDCCEGDNCNTFNYNMPPGNFDLNGKYCPSCGGYGLMECESKRMIQCQEEEDQCYEYFGEIEYPVPPATGNGELKGKYCPSCAGYGLRECKSKRMIQCEEEIDQCYEYFVQVIYPDGKEMEANSKGCISLEGCVLGFKYMVGLTELASPLFNCIKTVENF
ncbi:phospholipase A2 inhibitor gamma subunit B-like [Rhinoderma darwinii]|uniref:phospholipase A2 inhibitor gamma subunit B-like n=1 Tax=Rhinoderma darwinii TaxID=43563 RepID=UPI003F6751F9